ncbi:uncharacterized protein LOC125852094, partial [Solanum stenotomum]|uniref:uncharacterized protein LOC125852094 n=1 Tax=Solanum stenotomum TaxID=172797 RepID=UPI0020D1481C
MAEYEAYILGIRMALNMNVQELMIIGNSDLLIHQVQGEWAVKSPKILPYVQLVLYKRTPDLGLLRCVYAAEATKLFEEVHAGVCGTHMNGITLAKKILRAGYFWMTMENDCGRFVQKCHKYQVHGDLIKVPPHELNAMSSPWPFAAWGMDVIGPIEPAASNGHRFILVAIDYFTKWVEAASYKVVTKKVVADFVRNNLICRFGVPESIITNNGMNGVVEAANKNIKRMIDNYKCWHENLPYVLLGYRTTIRTSTRANPYLLVYGTEAVIPAEVEIPSLRFIQEAKLSDAEWVRDRYEQLALIDEKKMSVVCHGQLYQQRMTRAFNKKGRVRTFEVGQLVLKCIFPHQEEYKWKFAPHWQGPYVVHK